ncbi:hypothetical protein BASA50_003423 [Batrachochytrium salamandrivorans]|uniref:Secreted protein n=1 Tax=Batrachochytrium salamandrivorans TaxID=1357716 RepID=A0ABQ8FJX2_9FUNG|nr:hypothetical protein BASA50_003423 [Batrachochytrium salamandrivorans]
MIALSRCLTKLTVRNDVMDLLLNLFLLTCSVNEVPGRNDAVQNVFHFFSRFQNTPSRNPQRVGAGCTKSGIRCQTCVQFHFLNMIVNNGFDLGITTVKKCAAQPLFRSGRTIIRSTNSKVTEQVLFSSIRENAVPVK